MNAVITTHEINTKLKGVANYLSPRTDLNPPVPGATPVGLQVTAAGDPQTGEVRAWAVVLWALGD